jgi:iron complex outermembrane recepter protein
MIQRRIQSALLLAAVMSLLAAGRAGAQEATAPAAADASDTRLEEVVVTARKRTESLMTVPVAVTALSGSVLERRDVTNLQQVAQLAPQVTMVQGNSGNGATFSIRGLGSSFLDAGLEQTVAVNIDGVQIGRGHIISQAFFDISQVEVLKGPQALFFGKNSPAGVVSISSNNPGSSFEGMVKAGYEFEDRERYVEAVASGPVASTVGVRVAIRASQADGFLTNTAGPGTWQFSPGLYLPGAPIFQNPGFETRQPADKNLTLRTTLVWEPVAQFRATLKLQAGHAANNGINGLDQPVCFAGQTVPRAGGGPGGVGSGADPYGDCSLNEKRTGGALPPQVAVNYPGAQNGQPYGYDDAYFGTLSLNYDLSNHLTLNSVTGYYNLQTWGFDSLDDTSLSAAMLASGEYDETVSQELRLTSSFDAPVNFTVGAYYEHVKFTDETNILLGFFGVGVYPDPRTHSYNMTSRLSPNDNDATSAFGQVRWKIIDSLELDAGARWTEEKKQGFSYNAFVNQAFPLSFIVLPEGQRVGGDVTNVNVSPETTLSWTAAPDLLLYASYKTGYKSGGISNPQLLTANYATDSLFFKPEKARGEEIGFKASLLNRSMRVQLNAYNYNYSALQLSIFDNQSSSFIIKNAAEARIRGIEGSMDWRVVRDLTMDAAVGYNKARYASYPNAPCNYSNVAQCVDNAVSLTGQALARAPDWSGNLGATYDVPLSSKVQLAIGADMDFTSSYFSDDADEPHLLQKSFQRWNANLRLHDTDDRYELALIGRNLADKIIAAYSTNNIGGPPTQYNVNTVRPREIILQGTYRF